MYGIFYATFLWNYNISQAKKHSQLRQTFDLTDSDSYETIVTSFKPVSSIAGEDGKSSQNQSSVCLEMIEKKLDKSWKNVLFGKMMM